MSHFTPLSPFFIAELIFTYIYI